MNLCCITLTPFLNHPGLWPSLPPLAVNSTVHWVKKYSLLSFTPNHFVMRMFSSPSQQGSGNTDSSLYIYFFFNKNKNLFSTINIFRSTRQVGGGNRHFWKSSVLAKDKVKGKGKQARSWNIHHSAAVINEHFIRVNVQDVCDKALDADTKTDWMHNELFIAYCANV